MSVGQQNSFIFLKFLNPQSGIRLKKKKSEQQL